MASIYTAQNFDRLLGTPGFSDQLLKNHFTLYEGYVKNTNALLEKLDTLQVGTQEYAELQRRFGWEWNGMRLHELYFGNMVKDGKPLGDGVLKKRLESVYGSIDSWRKNFLGVGGMRGIGWVLLARDNQTHELFNIWVNEHDVGHLVGATPLLVMDVFEHAFMLDYGLKRADYIGAFMASIDWSVVEERLAKAMK